MNKILLAAISTMAVSSLASAASAHEIVVPKGKEACYGVSKAGANECASKDGSHACAGMAKTDNDPNEFILVNEGECDKLKKEVEGAKS